MIQRMSSLTVGFFRKRTPREMNEDHCAGHTLLVHCAAVLIGGGNRCSGKWG